MRDEAKTEQRADTAATDTRVYGVKSTKEKTLQELELNKNVKAASKIIVLKPQSTSASVITVSQFWLSPDEDPAASPPLGAPETPAWSWEATSTAADMA